jgi:hypothetical protein
MKTVRPLRSFAVAAVLATGALACGGGSTPTTPSTPPAGGGGGGGGGGTPPPGSVTVTITAAGLSNANVTVAAGGTITFVNGDNRVHDMSSDPHPQHTDCPGLNFGDLNPGQQRTSAALTTAGVCQFHDHLNPGTASLMGRLTIQ